MFAAVKSSQSTVTKDISSDVIKNSLPTILSDKLSEISIDAVSGILDGNLNKNKNKPKQKQIKTLHENRAKSFRLVSPIYDCDVKQNGCFRLSHNINGNFSLKMADPENTFTWIFINGSSTASWKEEIFFREPCSKQYYVVLEGLLFVGDENQNFYNLNILSDEECRQLRNIERKISCRSIGCGNRKDVREGWMFDCGENCLNSFGGVDCSPDYMAECQKPCNDLEMENGKIVKNGNGQGHVSCNPLFELDGAAELKCNGAKGRWRSKPICKKLHQSEIQLVKYNII